MTRTARPGAASTIEVTLTDLADDRPGSNGPAGGTGDRPPPNWRRVVGIASIAGAMTGVVVGVVILNADADDGDGRSPTTTATSAEATEMTTPPTLPPLDALPPPDFMAVDPQPTSPQPTSSQDRRLSDQQPTRPRFPEITGIPDGASDQYELDAAMAELGVDVSRRSTTRLEIGAEGYILDTRITYDAANGRYELVALSNAVIERLIIDIDGGWTYFDDSLNTWTRISNESLALSIGVPDMRTFVQRFMLGPIRPDTVDGALAVEPGPFVDLGGGLLAREHTVTVLAESVPEWADYRLGPIAEAPPGVLDQDISFSVYVTGEGNVRRIVAEWARGEKSQLMVHDLVRLTVPVSVELPPPSSVRDLDIPAVDPPDL